MYLESYKAPTMNVRVSRVEGKRPYGATDERVAVMIRAVKGTVTVTLGSAGEASYVLEPKSGTVELERLYVGAFTVVGDAVVTEFIRHDVRM